MKAKKALWGERHNGVLVNFKKNNVLLEKIFDKLSQTIKENMLKNFELSGRIKDAGMLKGKISRCQTKADLLTTKYEELGFRIVTRNFIEFTVIRDILAKKADFVKDYVSKPREDEKILGEKSKGCYVAFHVYTKEFFKKPIEIQILTEGMVKNNKILTDKYGGYWKTKEFKEKRLALGDDR